MRKYAGLIFMVMIFVIGFACVFSIGGTVVKGVDGYVPDQNKGIVCEVFGVWCPSGQ